METLQNTPMATAFDPHPVEDKWYQFWLDQKYFQGGEAS
jgi:valyl-tRNA synthetase